MKASAARTFSRSSTTRRLARRLDRGLRHGERRGQARTDLPGARPASRNDPVIETAEDALAVTLHETGGVDLDRIAELLGRSRETAIAELGERIFLDPQASLAQERDVWVTADAYLSGPIRTKLATAVAGAALDGVTVAMSAPSKRPCRRI